MKTLCLFLGCFALVNLQGQKLIKKAVVNASTEYIQIDSQFCYEVNLSTSIADEVTVAASIEGEYSKDLVVTIEEEAETLLISAGFQPNFANPNDKLSAHKVISIALDVTIPEYKDVFTYGTNSDVLVQGKYKKLRIKLSDGRCVLDNVEETVEVTTQKGDIILTTPKGSITAKSSYGEVHKEDIPLGDNQFTLNTIEGKIYLRKTK